MVVTFEGLLVTFFYTVLVTDLRRGKQTDLLNQLNLNINANGTRTILNF